MEKQRSERLRRFEERVSPHFRSAYNLARWLTRNDGDAEDVVQESFLRAFSSIEQLRDGDAKPWLLAIVRNTSMTWLRRARGGTEELAEDLREPSPDPEEALMISADREEVRRAVEELPDDYREAIVLRELEELSYKEIATVTGVPLGTVMSRLARGRECLRRILLRRRREPVRK